MPNKSNHIISSCCCYYTIVTVQINWKYTGAGFNFFNKTTNLNFVTKLEISAYAIGLTLDFL
jgi:hypothetical protein